MTVLTINYCLSWSSSSTPSSVDAIFFVVSYFIHIFLAGRLWKVRPHCWTKTNDGKISKWYLMGDLCVDLQVCDWSI